VAVAFATPTSATNPQERSSRAIDGFALGLAQPIAGRSVDHGELRMHRNPPQAFGDTDAHCE